MNTGMPDRASWNDFPEVLIHASESTVKKHPDYPAAKAGDIRAAKLLVVATLNDKLVAPIKEQLGGSNALLVPVHAYERQVSIAFLPCWLKCWGSGFP